MLSHFFHIESIAAALGILGAAWAIIRWLYHGANALRSTSRLVQHIWLNDLPHLTNAIRKLCRLNGLDYDEPPPPPPEIL